MATAGVYLDYSEVYGRPDRLIARLLGLEPDVLVMSNTELTVRYGRRVAEAAQAALIYEMHDDEAALLASIGSRAADGRAAALLQGAAVVAADGVVAFSDRDVDRALELGAHQAHLVPCGVTVRRPGSATVAKDRSGTAEPRRVGFVGNLHYEPNLRALRYLAHRLASHLRGRAVVDVFGRYPPAARRLVADAAVGDALALHGPVADLPAALAQMTLAVAPLDSGGGMKIKTLDYLAAGLAVVGTEEAFAGLDRPEELAMISHDPAMGDLPELVDALLDAPALRDELGARGQAHVVGHHDWAAVARAAELAYQSVAAAPRVSGRANGEPQHHQTSHQVAELARRIPYWLAEWRSRNLPLQDHATMTEHPSATGPRYHGPPTAAPACGPGEVALDIDCARLAAAGYAGRSMVFFAPEAVLKVYTHRARERADREVAGLELAQTHAPRVRVAEVLGYDDVPGGLSWVATTRLPGTHLSREQLAAGIVARRLGRLAARLHAIDAKHLDQLPNQARRIRDVPAGHPAGAEASRRLVEALEAVEPHQRPRCEPGFVHGDLSSRNVLLSDEPVTERRGDEHETPPVGVIDFEGSGKGCIYDDLATLVMQDGLLGAAAVGQLVGGYQDERTALGHPHPDVSRDHLALHLGWRARWILQWAVEVDPPLTEQVLALAPTLLADLARARAEAIE